MTGPLDTADDPPEPLFEGLRLIPGEDLAAIGGSLDPEVVFAAYQRGIFPWYDLGMPVLWWCPDPRALMPLDDRFHVPGRLVRTLADPALDIRRDTVFEEVMRACDEGRRDGTWIHEEMIAAYTALHRLGHAHSLEVFRDDVLVGGIYGVAFGAGFAAESMFHRERDMSKVALVHLVAHLRAQRFEVLDVQFRTTHLAQFGCVTIPRDDYLALVAAVAAQPDRF